MYLDDVVAAIRAHLPEDRMPDRDAEDLLRIYAVLLRAKGTAVTSSDIHDAWSAWTAKRNPEHAHLIAYENLPEDVQEKDRIFATAVRRAADSPGKTGASR